MSDKLVAQIRANESELYSVEYSRDYIGKLTLSDYSGISNSLVKNLSASCNLISLVSKSDGTLIIMESGEFRNLCATSKSGVLNFLMQKLVEINTEVVNNMTPFDLIN